MDRNLRDLIESCASCIIALALYLFIAPWLWGYSELPKASWCAWISAMVVAGFAITSWVWPKTQAEHASLFGGLWMIIAPWALHFVESSHAFWTHVCVGTGVVAFAAAEAWLLRRPTQARRQTHYPSDTHGSYST